MTQATLTHCLALLSAMPSSTPWTDASGALYSLALRGWSDDVARATVEEAALTLRWRPAPAELRALAVKAFAPAPAPGALREQLREALIWHGVSAGKVLDGSLPVLTLVADELGGWAALSRMASEEIDRAFPSAYERAVAGWVEQASAPGGALALGSSERAALVSGSTALAGPRRPAPKIALPAAGGRA